MRRSTLLATSLLASLTGVSVLAAPKSAAKPASKPAASAAATPPEPPMQAPDFRKMAGGAVARGLALLQSSSVTFSERKQCTSCHHQMLTSVAVDLARARGFKVNEDQARSQTQVFAKEFGQFRELIKLAESDEGAERQVDTLLVDPPVTAGYYLASLQATGYPKDDYSAYFALYLAGKQMEDGRWAVISGRPPQESSDFSATALAIRALRYYAPASRSVEERIERATRWLLAAKPKTGEDLAGRVLGLAWAKADPAEIRKAVEALVDAQQDDGGWSQLTGKDTDAYATGLALTALQNAGMAPTDPVYTRGALYLIIRQKGDGSWWVSSRSHPVQPYFETGFPHKRDQFISAAASAWAVIALLPFADASAPAAVAKR